LQPQILKVEFVGPLLLRFRLLLLLITFHHQRAENRFQRFAILRKVFQLRVHGVRLR
jgi:hypothetical protein